MSDGGVAGAGYLAIKVNDVELPAASNLVKHVTMIEGTYTFPHMLFEFNDMHHLFEGAYSIVDGTKITIAIGASADTAKAYDFRISGHRHYSQAGMPVIEAAGILDKSKFMFEAAAYSKRGNSTDVLADIAKKCGLEFKTDLVSDDSMVWQSLNTSPRSFIEYIERRMWIGEGKLPQTCVTLGSKLLLIDQVAELEKKPKLTICYNYPAQKGDIVAEEIRDKSVAGALNTSANYGSMTLRPNATSGVTDQMKGSKIKSKGALNINADIKESLEVTQIRHEHLDPISEGAGANVHRNWSKSQDQWVRLASTFTEACRILIRGKYDIPMFTTINLNAGVLDGAKFVLNKKISGNWIVVGRTLKLTSRGYVEAYLCYRNFIGAVGNSNLVSSSRGQNKPMTVQPTVADPSRPTQINMNIAEGAIDTLNKAQSAATEKLMSAFKSAGEAFGFSELKDKYGPDADMLDSLMSEFNMASIMNGLCQALSPLEKLSLDVSINSGPSILKALASRMDACEGMIGDFYGQMNRLVEKGDIPDAYLDAPSINTRCNLNKLQDINRAISDAYPDKCMDGFSLDRLHGPSLDLSKYLRQLEEWFRKFLCAFGDGNVDGSEKTLNTHVGVTGNYINKDF